MMAYGYGGAGMGWMMAANGVFWLIILVVAAVLLYRLARPHPHSLPGAGGSALDVLHERYVRGEIDRDEYLQKKKDLLDRS
jgi:putative membrane protein